MGKFEITNDHWSKFTNSLDVSVAGTPTNAYDANPYWTGTNVPTTNVSWYEAAQFVNWLNINTGHQPAYKFIGTQGTDDYILRTWDAAEAWGGTNLYRHKDAYYFLPTEDEWVKAAYWNGTNLQTYATVGDVTPAKDGWNYDYATDPQGPWSVGSGSEELNGTFDMMGNVYEWMESPYSTNYSYNSDRGIRSCSYYNLESNLRSSFRGGGVPPSHEDRNFGFRVASVPEPATLLLLGMGGLLMKKRK